MSLILDIQIDGHSMELFSDEDKNFYITKQLHDLRDLTTRKATFTKTITVPDHSTNQWILRQYFGYYTRATTGLISYSNVDIYMGGVPVIVQARLFSAKRNVLTKEIEITILGGDQDFFTQLKDEPISQLFTEVIPWTTADLALKVDEATFWVYADSLWTNNDSWEGFININSVGSNQLLGVMDTQLSGVFLYFREIWDRIMANLIDLNVINDWDTSLFDTQAMACAAQQFLDSFEKPAGFISAVNQETPSHYTEDQTEVVLTYDTVETDPENYWDIPSQSFIIGQDSTIRITVQGDFDVTWYQSGNTDVNEVSLLKNGTKIQTWEFQSNKDDTVFEFIAWETIITALTGDTFQLVITTGANASPLPYKINHHDGTFSVTSGAQSDEVLLSTIIPEINQKDFVKSILHFFHLVPYATARDIKFKNWDDIVNDEVDILDSKMDVSSDIIDSNNIPTYGQENEFRYLDDSNVARTDMNSSLPSYVEILPEKKTMIQLPYSACDLSFIPNEGGATEPRASVPAYPYKYEEIKGNQIQLKLNDLTYQTVDNNSLEPGDVITWKDGATLYRRRVVSVTTESEGIMNETWPNGDQSFDWQMFKYDTNNLNIHVVEISQNPESIHITDGSETLTTVVTNKKALFSDNLLWGTLLNNWYHRFGLSIEHPWALQFKMNLSIAEFQNISSLTPIWLSEFADYFYLNKIEQFKPDSLTRVELVRIWTEPANISDALLEITPVNTVVLDDWNEGDPQLDTIFSIKNLGPITVVVAITHSGGVEWSISNTGFPINSGATVDVTVSYLGGNPVGDELLEITFDPEDGPTLTRYVSVQTTNHAYAKDAAYIPVSGTITNEEGWIGINPASSPPFSFDFIFGDVLNSSITMSGSAQAKMLHQFIDEVTGDIIKEQINDLPTSTLSLDTGEQMVGYRGGRILVDYQQILDADAFALVIETTLGSEDVTLPLVNGGTFNFTVDWGDGSSDTITAWDDPLATHTYGVAGEYVVVMIGALTVFQVNAGAFATYPKRVIQWGQTGLTSINLNGCINLFEVPEDTANSFTSVTTLQFFLKGCISLTSVPAGIFQNCSLVITASEVFRESGILTVPSGIFDGLTAVVSMTSIFYGTPISSLPTGLLANQTQVTSLAFAFYNCPNLISVPEDIFSTVTLLESISSIFELCTGLVSVSDKLFIGNPNITTANAVFRDCSSLESLPGLLFSYSPLIITFSDLCKDCSSLVFVGDGIFAGNTEVTIMSSIFWGCSSLDTLPENLFTTNNKCTAFGFAFINCIALKLLPNVMFGTNTTPGIDMLRMFQSCTGLSGPIPGGYFTNMPNIDSFKDTFKACAGLQGDAPDLWNTHPTADGTTCFNGCNFDNQASIPVDWK